MAIAGTYVPMLVMDSAVLTAGIYVTGAEVPAVTIVLVAPEIVGVVLVIVTVARQFVNGHATAIVMDAMGVMAVTTPALLNAGMIAHHVQAPAPSYVKANVKPILALRFPLILME